LNRSAEDGNKKIMNDECSMLKLGRNSNQPLRVKPFIAPPPRAGEEWKGRMIRRTVRGDTSGGEFINKIFGV